MESQYIESLLNQKKTEENYEWINDLYFIKDDVEYIIQLNENANEMNSDSGSNNEEQSENISDIAEQEDNQMIIDDLPIESNIEQSEIESETDSQSEEDKKEFESFVEALERNKGQLMLTSFFKPNNK